jgi:hypothetical protein
MTVRTRNLTGFGDRGQTQNPTLQPGNPLGAFVAMVKRILVFLGLPFLVVGCATTFTNLTPQQQPRTTDNLYPVEFALGSRQQTLRWDSIRPEVLVGSETYELRPTPLMTNRWEGTVPIPKGKKLIQYRYKVDYEYNAMGKAKSGSAVSPEYQLRIVDP